MENASKALLIAASVLIVILLIAMGVRLFNSTSGTADAVEGTVKTEEIMLINKKFNDYRGPNKSVSEVKALANVVIAHNATVKTDSQKVGIKFKTGNVTKMYDAKKITEEVAKIKNGCSGYIYTYDDNKDGLIDLIELDRGFKR